MIGELGLKKCADDIIIKNNRKARLIIIASK